VLNGTAKRLLAEYHKLPAKLILTATDTTTTIVTRTITITPHQPERR